MLEIRLAERDGAILPKIDEVGAKLNIILDKVSVSQTALFESSIVLLIIIRKTVHKLRN